MPEPGLGAPPSSSQINLWTTPRRQGNFTTTSAAVVDRRALLISIGVHTSLNVLTPAEARAEALINHNCRSLSVNGSGGHYAHLPLHAGAEGSGEHLRQ